MIGPITLTGRRVGTVTPTLYYEDEFVTLYHGDCLDVLRELPDSSVDSIVTDPPYGLSNTKPAQVADVLKAWVTGDTKVVPAGKGFMGKDWDGFVPPPAVWEECLRVLKPGGHMAVFAGARTQDLMGLSIRLAGFEIRDTLGWVYGSGFPKSHDIGKAIDKRGGNAHLAIEIGKAIREARESRGLTKGWCDERFCGGTTNWSWFEGRPAGIHPPTVEVFGQIVAEWPELRAYAEKVAEVEREVVGVRTTGIGTGKGGTAFIGDSDNKDITAPASDAAKQWDGWGTALKPAIEPIILARKPLVGTVAANVLAHGVGGLNIDACRVGTSGGGTHCGNRNADGKCLGHGDARKSQENPTFHADEPSEPAGRFPANVLLDEHAAAEMDKQSGVSTSQGGNGTRGALRSDGAIYGAGDTERVAVKAFGDTGGASRFFPVFKYQAKAPKRERPVIEREDGTKIQHPTVKPVALMEWLVTLITPPNGTVLDPFAGSGSTLEAARNKGFNSIGIERETDYIRLIEARLGGASRCGKPARWISPTEVLF